MANYKIDGHRPAIEQFMIEGLSIQEMGRRLKTDDTGIRRALKRWGVEYSSSNIKNTTKKIERTWVPPVQITSNEDFLKKQTYIITSLLNDCPTDLNAVGTILQYAKHNNAQPIIIPVRYKNPSLVTGPQESHWPNNLGQYYLTDDLELCENLVVMGSMRIQATAADPLSGTGGCSKGRSAIFGHPKLALETIATPPTKMATVQFTTGTISKPQYSDTKAGRLGEFHHFTGAAIVEVEGDLFWWRHIEFQEDGSFIDFEKQYTLEGVFPAPPAEVVDMGDIHVDFHDVAVCDAILKDLCPKLKIKNVLWEDVMDFFSASHHHEKNPVLQVLKEKRNRDNVAAELQRVADWIINYMTLDRNYIIKESNHHSHLEKWLDRSSDKIDARNKWLWHQLNAARLREALDLVERDPDCKEWHVTSAFQLALETLLTDIPNRLSFHSANKPLMFCGIDFSPHGDLGPNGARGSAKGFANTNIKTTIMHSHAPRIVGTCFQGGKSCIDELPYMNGYSKHLSCSCLTYANGARTLFPIIDGRYRR